MRLFRGGFDKIIEEQDPQLRSGAIQINRDGKINVCGSVARRVKRVAGAIGEDAKFLEAAGFSDIDRLSRRAHNVARIMRFHIASASSDMNNYAVNFNELRSSICEFAPQLLDGYAARASLHRERMEAIGRHQSSLGLIAVNASGLIRQKIGENSWTGQDAQDLVLLGDKIDWIAVEEELNEKQKLAVPAVDQSVEPMLSPRRIVADGKLPRDHSGDGLPFTE